MISIYKASGDIGMSLFSCLYINIVSFPSMNTFIFADSYCSKWFYDIVMTIYTTKNSTLGYYLLIYC